MLEATPTKLQQGARPPVAQQGARPPVAPTPGRAPAVDERAARRTLHAQIARLETELGDALLTTWPRAVVDVRVGGGSGPRLQTLAELESLRDRMAETLTAARAELDERGRGWQEARRTREAMLLDPERYALVRISNEDVGEPGCRDWHVRPRFGLLGMLMRWWRVIVSSGCP
ncbi:MAG TPA: hypothetical protein VJT75_15220 [Thermoleophilaceae bacterium]|nr:hypothetical protein [Thermoleophilaceae bacterium]